MNGGTSDRAAQYARVADMRLLLPIAPPRTAASFGATPLAEALMRVGLDLITPKDATAVDLAVSSDPRPAAVHAAAETLRPGGALYLEAPLAFVRGRRRIRRRLRDAGFVDVTVYWRSTRGRITSAWVPIEASGPVEYFLGHRSGGRLGGIPLPRGLLRWVFRVARRTDLLTPLTAVARKPSDRPREGDEGVLDLLIRRWHDLAGNTGAPRLSWLVLAPGTRTISKIVAFVFAGDELSPRLIVKSGRDEQAAAGLEREALALQALEAHPRGRPPGAPACVLIEHRADRSVFVVETVVRGAPLYEALTDETFRGLALEAAAWLANLVRAEHRPRERLARAMETLLSEVQTALGSDSPLPNRLRELAASAGVLPVAFEQRDFSPWNLLLDTTGGLGVVDWESAEPDGFPLLDLMYFLANCGFLLDGADHVDACVRSYKRTFDPQSDRGAVAQACTRTYAARVGLSEDDATPLRALTWLVHLRNALRGATSGGHDDGLPSGPDLFAALLREELT
jgi:hypothetical protein